MTRLLFPGLILLCISQLVACTQLIEADTIASDLESVAYGNTTCNGDGGIYHLPRGLITVTISAQADSAGSFGINVVPNSSFVADTQETYCLDFLFSVFGKDKIGIEREKATGGNNKASTLLKRVYTKSESRTPTIARKVIQAGADLVAANKVPSIARDSVIAGVTEGSTLSAKFEFDPMNREQAEDVNRALERFGYCLYLQRRGDPFVPDWSPSLCDGALPRKGKRSQDTSRSGLDILYPGAVKDKDSRRGLLYRPTLAHSLIILKQDNPGLPDDPWFRAGSMRLLLPNAAPAFLLEVKRALFVTAETDIKFNQGMLSSIAIDKPSELKVVSEIGVEAVQTILRIPAETFKIFSNREENVRKLINVNKNLITTLNEYNKARTIPSQVNVPLTTAQAIPLGRQGNTESSARSSSEPDAMEECLNNPLVDERTDPVEHCNLLINGNL